MPMDWVPGEFKLHLAQWNMEVRREPGLISFAAGKEVPLRKILLIFSHIHVVKLGGVAGLLLDLLGHVSIGVDAKALQRSVDGFKACLFCSITPLQSLDHLCMGMWILQVEIERWWILSYCVGEATIPGPNMH
ncbi:Uncharacterised protein [uncultured archaeon]|nr:Uncharacterised protein [uncultured archaeon]